MANIKTGVEPRGSSCSGGANEINRKRISFVQLASSPTLITLMNLSSLALVILFAMSAKPAGVSSFLITQFLMLSCSHPQPTSRSSLSHLILIFNFNSWIIKRAKWLEAASLRLLNMARKQIWRDWQRRCGDWRRRRRRTLTASTWRIKFIHSNVAKNALRY